MSKVNWQPSYIVTGLSNEEKCGVVVARADILKASASFHVRSVLMNCKIVLTMKPYCQQIANIFDWALACDLKNQTEMSVSLSSFLYLVNPL